MNLQLTIKATVSEDYPTLQQSGDTDTLFDSRECSDNRQGRIFNKIKRNVTIEPLMFCHMFALTTSAVVLQNFYIDRICRVTLGYDEQLCANLTQNGDPSLHDIETEMDTRVARFNLYRGLIEAGVPSICSLFLGPWIDKHGTKSSILLPLFGYAISAMMYIIFSFFPDVSPDYLLLCSIPVALSGGMVALILSAFSFMTLKTDMNNRSFRIAILEASWFLGSPIGLLVGAQMYKTLGFLPVFIMSCSLYTIAFLYGLIFIKEDKPELPEELSTRSSCCADMFNVYAVIEVFSTIVRKRQSSKRLWILLFLTAISLRVFCLFGGLNVTYLYTRNKFHWNLQKFSQYNVFESFIGITGSYIMIMTTMKIFKVSDSVIGAISTIGYILGNVLLAVATKGWMMYLASCLSMFSGLISIVCRSMLSKCVSKDEIAKVFTFLSSAEALMPLLATPLYNIVFIKTASSFSGTVFLLTSGISGLVLLIFLYFVVATRKNLEHSELEESNESSYT